MNERSESDEPISPTPGGSENRYTGSQGEPYEDEVEAEREGTTAEQVEQEEGDEPSGEAARWFTG